MSTNPVSSLKFLNETKGKIKYSRFSAIISLILIVSVAGLIIFYLSQNYASSIFHPAELREGLIGYPRFLNPLFAPENETDRTVCRLIFNSLVKYDFDKKEFVGDLAEKFVIENDSKTYRFYLKDNVYFHDNEKLTIDDILFTYNLIQYENYHGYWKDAFADVKIEKVNDLELTMTLKKPVASFLEHNTVGILPAHYFENFDDALRPDNTFNVSPIGSGKYKYSNKQIRQENENQEWVSLLLERTEKKVTPQKIRFIFYKDENDLLDAFKMSEIDAFGSLNYSLTQTLKDWQNFELQTHSLSQRYYGLFFNLKSDKLVNDFNLRKALALSFDKNDLLANVFPEDKLTILTGPLEPNSWAYDSKIITYNYDLEQAKTLLASYDSENLKFTFTYPYTETNQKIVTYLVNKWHEIGITIETRPISINQLRDQVLGPRNFEILLLGQETSLDPDRYSLWHSTQVNYPDLNISQIEDRFIDRALENGRKETDLEKRKTAYNDFQRYFQKELPAITLYSPNYYYFVRQRFSDKIKVNYLGTPEDRFNKLLN